MAAASLKTCQRTRFVNRPRNTVNLSLDWSDPLRGWDAGLRFEYRSSQWLEDGGIQYKAGDLGLWHVTIGKDFREIFELTLNVENITDRQLDDISEHFNYYERGRFFSLGALYRFR